MIIKSDKIYFEDGVKSGYLEIENGKFKKFYGNLDTDSFVDYTGYIILPGIIDTHNHGTCGYSMIVDKETELNDESTKGYLKGLASQGVTGIFPTVNPESIKQVAVSAGEGFEGAKILGIHCEGPWLNRVGEKGIKTGWPDAKIETAQKMFSDGAGLLKIVSLAPEIPGMDSIIDYFIENDVSIGFAHSDLKYEKAIQAYNKGITVATHTGNVMTGIHHRDVGGLGASLLTDDVWCEVICDGMHVCTEMIEIYFRVKDKSRFIIISDCTPFSNAPVGSYPGWFAGMTINVDEDGFVLSDTNRLMGSSQPVLYGISVLNRKLCIPLEEIIKMTSLNPAIKYGFSDAKGSIKEGKDADFIVIDDNFECHATFVEGEKVYNKAKDIYLFNPRFLEEKIE
jgi:N-acetylglucosamine-6-phosphate deacetylase